MGLMDFGPKVGMPAQIGQPGDQARTPGAPTENRYQRPTMGQRPMGRLGRGVQRNMSRLPMRSFAR